MRSQEEPGGARRSLEELGGARRNQEEPGATRSNMLPKTYCKHQAVVTFGFLAEVYQDAGLKISRSDGLIRALSDLSDIGSLIVFSYNQTWDRSDTALYQTCLS